MINNDFYLKRITDILCDLEDGKIDSAKKKCKEEIYIFSDNPFSLFIKNHWYMEIIKCLVAYTKKGEGTTAYRISKDLDIDQGNVREYLMYLEKLNILSMNESVKNGRIRHEFFALDELVKFYKSLEDIL